MNFSDERVYAPFWCPWCEKEITDEDGYDHAFEHMDVAPTAVEVEAALAEAQEGSR